tara:strand:- start:384 stop:926 length:543 start_codon:yes stop_codon:yes gene_type:complete
LSIEKDKRKIISSDAWQYFFETYCCTSGESEGNEKKKKKEKDLGKGKENGGSNDGKDASNPKGKARESEERVGQGHVDGLTLEDEGAADCVNSFSSGPATSIRKSFHTSESDCHTCYDASKLEKEQVGVPGMLHLLLHLLQNYNTVFRVDFGSPTYSIYFFLSLENLGEEYQGCSKSREE